MRHEVKPVFDRPSVNEKLADLEHVFHENLQVRPAREVFLLKIYPALVGQAFQVDDKTLAQNLDIAVDEENLLVNYPELLFGNGERPPSTWSFSKVFFSRLKKARLNSCLVRRAKKRASPSAKLPTENPLAVVG